MKSKKEDINLDPLPSLYTQTGTHIHTHNYNTHSYTHTQAGMLHLVEDGF